MIDSEKLIQLQQQNKCLKLQVKQWKNKYYALYSTYKSTFQNISPIDHLSLAQENQLNHQNTTPQLKLNQGISKISRIQQKDSKSSMIFNNGQGNPLAQKNINGSLIKSKHELQELNLALIQSCFIFQKKRSKGFNYIKQSYPSSNNKIMVDIYDTIYRFVFIDEEIEEIIDDQCQSIKNQILYGSNYQYFHYVFDGTDTNHSKTASNLFLKDTHLMMQKHVYGIVKPEILLINDKYYETQIAIGFISQVPIPTLFKNINRVIQQEIKLKLLNSSSSQINHRLGIMANILQNITNHTIQDQLTINKFPINFNINTSLFDINLKYTSAEGFIYDQLNFYQNIIANYSKKKIIKIIHYMLAQKSIIVICKSRKSLNQLFEILKIIIHPLNWIFPVVYSYSDFYEPFLNSPIPILIGYVKRDYYQDWQVDVQDQLFAPNDLLQINAEDEKNDLKEIAKFSKRIKGCEKFINKDIKEQTISKSNLVPQGFHKRILQNNLCFKLYYYVQMQLKTIFSPCPEQQFDQFLSNMAQTQMVSYYKQNQ